MNPTRGRQAVEEPPISTVEASSAPITSIIESPVRVLRTKRSELVGAQTPPAPLSVALA